MQPVVVDIASSLSFDNAEQRYDSLKNVTKCGLCTIKRCFPEDILFYLVSFLSIAAYFFSEYSIEMNKDIKRKKKIPRVAEKKHNNS